MTKGSYLILLLVISILLRLIASVNVGRSPAHGPRLGKDEPQLPRRNLIDKVLLLLNILLIFVLLRHASHPLVNYQILCLVYR